MNSQPTNQPPVPKPVKERDSMDLLELVFQLHSRYVRYYNNREIYVAYIEARKELESRLTPPATVIQKDAEQYFNTHKRTFDGINAGEFIDKEDFLKFAETLSTSPTVIQPLQWVKAKDDFPKEKGNYFLRHPYEDGRFHGWWAYVVPEAIYKEYWIKMGYEWLSESTPPNQLSGIEVDIPSNLMQIAVDEFKELPVGVQAIMKQSNWLAGFCEGFKKCIKAGYAASEGEEAIGDVTCVFCNDVCEPAPTKRGWSKIRNRHGLHFDCAKKVSDQGEVINKIEFLTWLRENGWLHNPYKSNDELIDEYNNR